MSRYVLGFDGGGTSTVAWLASVDAGPILGEGHAGPSNPKSVGSQRARQALETARSAAFSAAGLEVGSVEAVCLGLAGVDRPDDRAEVEGWIATWGRRRAISNDAELVIAAASELGWGIALIAGTGSICVGRSPTGLVRRAGGWGHLLGDEGSAYGVAVHALRAMVRYTDGRDIDQSGSDILIRCLNRAIGMSDLNGWITELYSNRFDRARIAGLASAVSEAADQGSDAAGRVLDNAARELACAVLAVYRALGFVPGTDSPLVPLGMAGGFALNCARVREGILSELARLGVPYQFQAVPDPVAGAIRLAQALAVAGN